MTSKAPHPGLTSHAERAYPNECVGALLGRGETIHETLELENASPTPGRAFELTAREYLRAEASAAEKGLELLGFYHSHPDAPAEPSARDRELLGKFAVNVIVEVRGGVVTRMTTWSGE
jgi:proteasome lid subunit RPN8/RPN11